jgi:hypothetical protein
LEVLLSILLSLVVVEEEVLTLVVEVLVDFLLELHYQ